MARLVAMNHSRVTISCSAGVRTVPRFSLRTLLAGVLVCCLVLAAVGAQLRWRATQQRVLAAREGFGPSVVYNPGSVVALLMKQSLPADRSGPDRAPRAGPACWGLAWTKVSDD